MHCEIKELRRRETLFVSRRTRPTEGLGVRVDTSPADVMPPHDFEEAGMIGEAERLRGPRDLPIVSLQGRDDDLALGLRLEGMKRGGARASVRTRWTGPFPDVGGDVVHTDRLTVRRGDHPLRNTPHLADVVARPILSHQARERPPRGRLGSPRATGP